MSRPRKPYGPNPPGRLLGTMIKVLAAELSDQGRLSRGKRYWADDAVIDIVVGHGAVTAEVQGSRQQPYVVTIEARAGEGVPGRRDIWAQCTCPDDVGTGVDLCKHAVAACFALADEVTIEPELVDRWRAARHFDGGSSDRDVSEGSFADSDLADIAELPRSRAGLVEAVDDDRGDDGRRADVIELRPNRFGGDDETVRADDMISPLLQAPAGAAPPTFPEVTPLDQGSIRNRLLGEVLEDALDHLAIRWE